MHQVYRISSSDDVETNSVALSLSLGEGRPNVLLFDIQDIGARYYTYVYTMALAMEAAASNPALAAFIEEGHFATHVRRMRRLYAARQAALVAAGVMIAGVLVARASASMVASMAWRDATPSRSAISLPDRP